MLSKRLREILNERKISLTDFAEMCEMQGLPVDTVRNVYYGKTVDPKISTVMVMSKVLNMSVNCLMGQCSHTPEERQLLRYYRTCGVHGKSLIFLTSKYEALSAKDEREATDRHMIPCLIPHGDIRQGVIYDACEVVEIFTSCKEAYVAVKMTNNDLVPTYCKDDIILISNSFPRNKEYGVFYKNGRAYIREYLEEEGQYRLKCLHKMGEDMIFKRMDEIEYIGTCCGVIRA